MSKRNNPAARLLHAILAFDWYIYLVLLVTGGIFLMVGMIFGLLLAADMPGGSMYFPMSA